MICRFLITLIAFTSVASAGLPADMQPIPSGTFVQGLNSQAEKAAFGRPNLSEFKADRLPLRPTTLKAFAIGKFEVTNEDYAKILQEALTRGWAKVDSIVLVNQIGEPKTLIDLGNPFCEITIVDGRLAATPERRRHPVTAVTWYGALFFAWAKNELEKRPQGISLDSWEIDFSKAGYRLPSEAEWEYAARGGKENCWFPWGDKIDHSHANYFQSGDAFDDPFGHPSSKGTTPVGYFNGKQTPPGEDMANAFGLHDMAGNVMEWCADWYAIDAYGGKATPPVDFKQHAKVVASIASGPAAKNPTGPKSGLARVLRGGSWRLGKHLLGCSMRFADFPERADRAIGFRLVLGQ